MHWIKLLIVHSERSWDMSVRKNQNELILNEAIFRCWINRLLISLWNKWVHCWTDRWFFDIRYNIYLLVLWLYYFLSVMYIWRDTSIHILYALLQFSLPATAHSNLIKWFLPRLLFQSLKNWKFRESPFLIYDELCLLVQACPHKICRHRW